MGKNIVVLGTQWGDEGKGKIVDLLTEQVTAVVRFQGEIVICELSGQGSTPEDMACDRQLEYKDGQWTVISQ